MGNVVENQTVTKENEMKFCKHCGTKIPADAVICTSCGRQVETIKSDANQPNIVINNSNSSNNVNQNVNQNVAGVPVIVAKPKNKWVALTLCILLGWLGGHKFYEGKTGMGILYLLTCGLFFVGVVIDFIAILTKPNPYYV